MRAIFLQKIFKTFIKISSETVFNNCLSNNRLSSLPMKNRLQMVNGTVPQTVIFSDFLNMFPNPY